MSCEPYICSECGTKIQRHRHSLNRGLAESLVVVYKADRRNPVRISDLGLDHCQLANFQKLAYWGLVSPHVTPDNQHRRGWWLITENGCMFVENRLTMPRQVWTLRGKRQSFEGERIKIIDVIEGYEYRGDYSRSARPEGEPPGGEQQQLFNEI